jgi:hypothetical protein
LIGDEGISALATAPAGFRLRRLGLDSCEVGGRGVRRLARDPAFAELRELLLVAAASEEALVELLNSPNLANLHTLFLYCVSRVGQATLRALMTSPTLQRLRSLTLFPKQILGGRRRFRQFARWPGLARLESLTLLGGLTEDNLRELAASPYLRAVRVSGFHQIPG